MKEQHYLPELKVLEREENKFSPFSIKGFIQKYDEFIDKTNTEGMEDYFRDMASSFYAEGFKEGYQQAKAEQGKIC